MQRKFSKFIPLFSALIFLSSPLYGEDWSLDDIRDRMQIEELMNQYLYALDKVDPEAYAAVFTSDGKLVVRETNAADDYIEEGHEEIKAYLIGLRNAWDMPPFGNGGPSFGPLRHVYYNFIVEVDGDSAKAETYWTTRAQNPEGGAAIIASMGRSEDFFVKQNGKWLFKERIIIVDMDTPLPSIE